MQKTYKLQRQQYKYWYSCEKVMKVYANSFTGLGISVV